MLQGIAVICSVCQKQGHIDKNCPSERLPAPDPLPPMTRQFHDLLCRILAKVHSKLILTSKVNNLFSVIDWCIYFILYLVTDVIF